MSSPAKPTTFLSPSLRVACGSFCILVAVLLIGKRLDFSFAGGSGAGEHKPATLQSMYFVNAPDTSFPPPSLLARGETVTTDATTFAAYAIDTCTIHLAEHSSLTLLDGRKDYAIFSLLTGRAIADGDCTFTTRETEVSIMGSATIIHFSWLNTIVVKVFSGSATISQSGITTALTPETPATHFSTLPNLITQTQEEISLTQNDLITSFYAWGRKK